MAFIFLYLFQNAICSPPSLMFPGQSVTAPTSQFSASLSTRMTRPWSPAPKEGKLRPCSTTTREPGTDASAHYDYLEKTDLKIIGKSLENHWKTIGTSLEHHWKTIGKSFRFYKVDFGLSLSNQAIRLGKHPSHFATYEPRPSAGRSLHISDLKCLVLDIHGDKLPTK